MAADPLKILYMRMRVRSLILFALMVIYICFSLFLFFQWVAPSLDGRTDQHIAADSSTYLYIADSLRSGTLDPFWLAGLSSFPNTLWSPVLLALVLKSTFAMVLANYAMFFLSLFLLKKSYSFSTGVFLGLLLLNATTTVSLLSLNKEIIDFLVVSIFLFARQRRLKSALLLSLLLAFFNRFEVFTVLLTFLVIHSKLNPWHRRRVVTLVVLIIIISVTLPLFMSNSLSNNYAVVSGIQNVTWLDTYVMKPLDMLEMHYLYGVVVIPKIAENLFGALLAFFKFKSYFDFSDLANSYIVRLNNLATVIVLVILARKRMFSVRSDLVYFAMLGWIIMSVSMVIQPRYIYFAYVLLCLQAAHTESSELAEIVLLHKQSCSGYYASLR
jgi:hypothetical protein